VSACPDYFLPDYSRQCIDSVLGISGFGGPGRGRVILFVVDGLGTTALRARPTVAPWLTKHLDGSVSSVVPTTTAAALTSLTTGVPPGVHGVTGQMVPVRGADGGWREYDVLRSRWKGTDRTGEPPSLCGGATPFPAGRPYVVSKFKHLGTGFTRLHLGGDPDGWWKMPSAVAVAVREALRATDGDVYVYYDGLDTTAHHHGFGERYDAELAYVDSVFATLAELAGPGVSLVATADHGCVPVDRYLHVPPELSARAAAVGGEDRNAYLIARPGDEAGLAADVRAAFGDAAWVFDVAQLLDLGLYGPTVGPATVARLGTVRVFPFAGYGLRLSAPPGTGPDAPPEPVCSHGSLTEDEMYVPVVAVREETR
jgi:hypothetical protein